MGRPRKEKPNHTSGMYEVKITIGKTFDGKLVRKSFYSAISKADARAKAEQYKINRAVQQITGEVLDESPASFENWSKKVLESLKGTVKDSSWNLTYKTSIEKHLIPYFGKRRIADIRQIDIQNYFNQKGCTLALETLKKHKMALGRIFDAAVLNDMIARNPCINIKLKSSVGAAPKRTYTKEECRKVLEYAKSHRFGLGVHLMLMYGISRSELLGLRWEDVDLGEKILHIRHGVADVQGTDGKMQVILGEPKNDFRRRDVPISTETAALLNAAFCDDHEFVISNTNGTMCSPRTWSRRHYDVFMNDMQTHYAKQEENIPKLTPHELRHTRASIWVNDGENLFAVADVLGHADLKMLRKRYAHSDVESTRKLLKIE
ncbi:MAG: site-specific integrase [Ruminococcus sp.]|nr:site-specific integrase [Ruminococcus sp.]